MGIKINFKKIIGEGSLIVFSVLFALLINKAFENYKVNKQKNIAKESIKNELIENQQIIIKWKEKHIAIKNRILKILKNKEDSTRIELTKDNYFNFGVLTNNQSVASRIPTDTGWETAKTTGIISEFEYQTIQNLSQVYDLQDFILEKTFAKLTDYFLVKSLMILKI